MRYFIVASLILLGACGEPEVEPDAEAFALTFDELMSGNSALHADIDYVALEIKEELNMDAEMADELIASIEDRSEEQVRVTAFDE
ncbi:hypothetical protein [Alkalicoccus luteus]|uniref:hypothetical protein n=1 Tax=Alkalicoccus luteus TaxID=1237094 RepID=UPI004033C75B